MSDVVLAVRGGNRPKSRCSALLSEADRRTLVAVMLSDMLNAVAASRSVKRVWLVTRSRSLAKQARAAGATAILQEGGGLNAAFARAQTVLASQSPDALVAFLPGDLPLISARELDYAFAKAARSVPVLVPADADGGTNGIFLRAGDLFPFRFGAASFVRHVAAAREMGRTPKILPLPSLGFDVDRPTDVLAMLECNAHTVTTRFLRERLTLQPAIAEPLAEMIEAY